MGGLRCYLVVGRLNNIPPLCVRVRWADDKCKVNSDEFNEEATLCLCWVYICPVVLSSRSFQQFHPYELPQLWGPTA
jgi:hypothetical protein